MPGSADTTYRSSAPGIATWLRLAFATAIAISYLGSFSYLKRNSEDFIVRERVERVTPLKLPVVLDFSTSGSADYALGSGFSYPEDWGAWTSAPVAKLATRIRDVDTNSRLLLRIHSDRAFLGRKALAVTVYANGKRVAQRRFERSEPVLIEGEFTWTRSGERFDLRLEIEGATSPASRGMNADARLLGLGIQKIEILPAYSSADRETENPLLP